MLEVFGHMCTVRAIAAGTKAQSEDLVKVIDANGIKPVLDKRIFEFEDVKAACEYPVSLKPYERDKTNNTYS
jgi:hypothetical protein